MRLDNSGELAPRGTAFKSRANRSFHAFPERSGQQLKQGVARRTAYDPVKPSVLPRKTMQIL
jgi:hypothetical protein